MNRFAILLALSVLHASRSYAIGIEAKPSFVPKDPSKKPPNYVDLTYCCRLDEQPLRHHNGAITVTRKMAHGFADAEEPAR